jgi:hypothetical protein
VENDVRMLGNHAPAPSGRAPVITGFAPCDIPCRKPVLAASPLAQPVADRDFNLG